MTIPEKYVKGEPQCGEGKCVRCGETIHGNVTLLMFDQRFNEYHDFGGIPDNKNQGSFAFDEYCARALRKRTNAAINIHNFVLQNGLRGGVIFPYKNYKGHGFA